jgi:ribosomal protein S21
MTETKRKKNETFESLLRRFTKKMQQSGKVLQAKKVRYFVKEANKNLNKKLALRRKDIREERESLKKIGKLKDE